MFANRLPLYTASKLLSAERIWRAILELVAAITRVFNIMDEEVLEAVAGESDVLVVLASSVILSYRLAPVKMLLSHF